jgi:arabinose-5-phosphate isomerase
MASSGIETDLDLSGSASSIAEIFIDRDGERVIYMAAGATAETRPEHVRKNHLAFLARGRRLSTEVSQLPLDTTLEALRVAHEQGLTTVVDLDVLPSDIVEGDDDRALLEAILRETDLLKPTALAARELFPELSELDALARRIRKSFSVPTVVITDGERGSLLANDDGERWVQAYQAATVLDSTGAGDAFLGGYLAAEALGLDATQSAKLGNACGAACVEQLGAFPGDPAALRRRIAELYGAIPPTVGGREQATTASIQVGGAVGRRVLEVAARELTLLGERHDGTSLEAAADLVEKAQAEGGRVHVMGVGKPEHVAHYAASLLSSTGTPATFLHATEALHGSLGQIVPGDVVIAISNSGTTPECLLAVEAVRGYGGRVIAVTGGLASPLAEAADVTLDAAVKEEGGPLGLAPRASVAAEVLVLSALGAVLQQRGRFDREGYAARHPAGALGKQARRG